MESVDKREKLKQMGEQVRIGGKGSARRKRKVVHKNIVTDDKKLQTSLKKLGMNDIRDIEEVNMFKNDGNILHFKNPKVQANIQANIFSVSGQCETKSLSEMLPSIWNQLGPINFENLKAIAAQLGDKEGKTASKITEEVDDDDDVPDLVADFDAPSKTE